MTQTVVYTRDEDSALVEYQGVEPWQFAEVSRNLLEELLHDAGWDKEVDSWVGR